MIAKILEGAEFKIAVVSTINFKIDEREWINETKFTTFSSFRLQRHFKEAIKAGCEYAVIEVTSHSLDQNRVWGVDFNVAVITNVTREHLDYHRTIRKYRKAKEKLFAMVARNENGVTVVNLEMEDAEDFLKYRAKQNYGYVAVGNSQLVISDKLQITNYKLQEIVAKKVKLDLSGSLFEINGVEFKLYLPGLFNIENTLAATCVGLSQGISLYIISKALEKIKLIPGRMERIESNRGIEIVVDYAVTPDSLEKLYDYIGKLKKAGSRVIAVFGSCGERDRGKRPIMGKVVAKRHRFRDSNE